jgi:hypothetical protein
MRDRHTIAAVALQHPKYIPLVTGFINDAEAGLGITLRVVQGGRTFEYQDSLYAIGRTVMGANPTPAMPMGHKVTNAKGGESYHCYWVADDVVPVNVDGTLNWKYNFSLLVPYAIKYGITWGGYFSSPDYDHFENKFNLDWREMLRRYNAGDFIPGTHFINI